DARGLVTQHLMQDVEEEEQARRGERREHEVAVRVDLAHPHQPHTGNQQHQRREVQARVDRGQEEVRTQPRRRWKAPDSDLGGEQHHSRRTLSRSRSSRSWSSLTMSGKSLLTPWYVPRTRPRLSTSTIALLCESGIAVSLRSSATCSLKPSLISDQ